jgi:hypothetical protein
MKHTNDKNIEIRLKKQYKRKTGRQLDLNNPQTYCEKVQWEKLYNRDPLRARLADKYAVREYVASHVGEEYLIPLLGVWEDSRDIDFDALPKEFVLKCNHGCSWNIIVKDKAKLNISKARRKLNHWMSLDLSSLAFEMHYTDIPRKIIAEKYLESATEAGGLRDYKFYCFNGEPRFVKLVAERPNFRINWYDLNWVLQPFNNIYEAIPYPVEKPDNLPAMTEIARKLSKGFPHVRVDLYSVGGKIYFGEMTFTAGSGYELFYPDEYNRILGDMYTLPKAE